MTHSLGQYLGPCLMHEDRAHDLFGIISATHARLPSGGVYDVQPSGATMTDGIAIIEIAGMLSKAGDPWLGGVSTVAAREVLRDAARRADAIVIRIDSPGGTLPGVDDLARDVKRIALSMPVVAYIEDVGASAAYWIASQATRVVANPSAWVGAIGVFSTVVDSSQAAAQRGLKVHIVKSASGKAHGVDGIAVTDETLAERQRMVDAVHAQFIEAVSRGRGKRIADVLALADGRIYPAHEAQRLGLIDSVSDFDSVVASLVADARGLGKSEDEAMNKTRRTTTTTKAKPRPKPKPLGYLDLVQQRQRKTGETRAAAMAAVARSHPELHERWVNQQCDKAQTRPIRGRKAGGGWMRDTRTYAARHEISLHEAMRRRVAADPQGHQRWLDSLTP